MDRPVCNLFYFVFFGMYVLRADSFKPNIISPILIQVSKQAHKVIIFGSLHFLSFQTRLLKPTNTARRRRLSVYGSALTAKMKSRLAASIYFSSAGKCWAYSRSAVSSRSIFAIFDRRHGQIDCSFHARRFVSSNRAVHSSALEDDAFSELGPPESKCSKKNKSVSKKVYNFVDDVVFSDLNDAFSELGHGISDCSTKQLKLVTEKPDHFQNTHIHRRETVSMPKSSDCGHNTKELPESSNGVFNTNLLLNVLRVSTNSSTKHHAPVHTPRSASNNELASKSISSDYRPDTKKFGATTEASAASSTKLSSPNHAPTSTDDTRKISEMKYPLSISVKNIPSEVGLPVLIEAISVFGKVSGASFVATSDIFKSCTIEFEDADSSKRATLAGKVKVGSCVFRVTSLDGVDLVAVRIKNIKDTTSDSAVHSICKSAGELAGLTRTSKNSVNAFFNVRNDMSHLDIVKKLNNTVFDLNHWSASVLTNISNSSEVPSEKEARYKLHSQILNLFSKLNADLGMKKIYLDDLEYLNAGIMYIQDHHLL